MSRLKIFPAFILTALFLFGCSGESAYTRNFILMDTFVRVEIKDPIARNLKARAVSAAFDRMKVLEAVFDYFAEEGELRRINRLQGGGDIVLSREMLTVLKAANEFHERSDGAFDVTLGRGGWALDEKKRIFTASQGGADINLGGIAKGFIVDEGIKVLKEAGIRDALINAGGDMYCLGDGSGAGWKVGIRDPKDRQKVVAVFYVRDSAVATSGGYERPLHIVDPRTKKPLSMTKRSVTVVANDCMTADALATALYVLGPERGLSLIGTIDGAKCFMIDEDGKRYLSSGFPPLTNP